MDALTFIHVIKFRLSLYNWFYITHNKHLFSHTEANNHLLLIQIHGN